GKMDLSQAEAVADLIASDNAASHQLAMQQMRGGFSNQIAELRQELLNFASLIELELDFSEEDVAFADRSEFKALVEKIIQVLKRLVDSFEVGNVLKNGIPVAIIGEPNVGKSTLLNALLNEERAIVSEIAGTTRDTVEDEISLGGIGFRFIDTAGIRETEDVVESIGIKKTFEKIEQAQLVLLLVDTERVKSDNHNLADKVEEIRERFPQKPLLVLANKIDKLGETDSKKVINQLQKIQGIKEENIIPISAKTGKGLEGLKTNLTNLVNTAALRNNETIVTNSRHYDALQKALEEMFNVKNGLDTGISGDLLAIDIRQALYHLGEITGAISTDDLLGNIFANFCIGK
ncbi:MAG: tRNA uridine-5-carboxymethylaminomethyl(34) synthesis GTPase MnmE, partial [Flavobacteriaceae bacterium]|nr:tRNA uridine-5-carboxymethylaminomethyl(34) synthesis GTPase MnmE [Flavobacteriaceae bacterium]